MIKNYRIWWQIVCAKIKDAKCEELMLKNAPAIVQDTRNEWEKATEELFTLPKYQCHPRYPTVTVSPMQKALHGPEVSQTVHTQPFPTTNSSSPLVHR